MDLAVFSSFLLRALKRIVTLTAALVALGIAGFVVSRRDGGYYSPANPNPKSAGVMLPAKTGRNDDDHHAARFESLDEGMRKIAEQLETAAIKWNRARPTHESFHKLNNDRDEFSTARISELETHQIRFLGEWVTGELTPYVSELNDYRQAIIKVWASREPDVVRSHLLNIAETRGVVGKELNSWEKPGLEELSDNFHFYRVGHAMLDPKGAMDEFLKDSAEPLMKYLVSEMTTLPELFREYAARDPEQAWIVALSLANEDYHHRMIEGFADGAPAGQDWEKRSAEFVASLANRGIEPSRRDFRSIAERWVMEDPSAALDWFARMTVPLIENQSEDFLTEDHAETAPASKDEVATRLKLDLIISMYGSHKNRMDEVISAVDHLASNGNAPLAARALGELIGDSLDPMHTPLVGLIPKFPSSELRGELLLRAANAIPARGKSLDAILSDPLGGPNPTLEAVRELAAQLDLTPEIRAQAEAAFRKVEAAELQALEDQERLRRFKSDTTQDDPFSSR